MAIIAICRGSKSGGGAMARCLADGLGYPILGREIVQDAAAELGVPAQLLEQRMDARPTLWSRFSSLRRTYMVAVQAAMAEYVVEGDLVYHGLAGGLLLRGLPATLSLRLIAPLEYRKRAVVAASEMDDAMAEAYVRELDETRGQWVKVMYGEDIADPRLFDMVVSLGKLTIEGACAVVVKTIQRPEYQITEEVRARLMDFRSACRVKLALVRDSELSGLDLDAAVEDGAVVITGEAPLLKGGRTGNRIVELARSVPGVDEVRLKVEWFDPYP